MPIASSVVFNLSGGQISNGQTYLREVDSAASNTLFLIPSVIETNNLLQLPNSISQDSVVLLTGGLEGLGQTTLVPDSEIFNITFPLSEESLDLLNTLQLVVGDLPVANNPFTNHTTVDLVDTYSILLTNFHVVDVPRRIETLGSLVLLPTGTITSSGILTLTDELGPELFNITPASGSSFNNPESVIEFDLVDTGGSTIVSSSVDIRINGILVIDNGVNVTPLGYGTTSFSQISSTFYQFQFISASGFNLGTDVGVSGTARDSISPTPNISNFVYTFKIWGEDTLGATLSGAADVTAPVLDNVVPGNLSTNIPVDSNIGFDIFDEHTGVDVSSILVYINNSLVYSGTDNLDPTNFDITASGFLFGKSFNFNIDPIDNFGFGQTIQVRVVADDLYSPPNSMDETYFFTTQTNSNLVASGFKVSVVSVFEDMLIGETYPTELPTEFVIDYIDLLGSGIDTVGSHVALNGDIIPSTFVSVTGSYSHYKVYFDLTPDYTTDADLIFHVQQSGTVLGNIVSRDFNTELLWGYEYIYDPDDPLELNHFVDSLVQVNDHADYPSAGYSLVQFTTRPHSKNTVTATIVGVEPPHGDLMGSFVSNNAFFEYGKTMEVTVEAEDNAGNKLNFTWNFTIEDET